MKFNVEYAVTFKLIDIEKHRILVGLENSQMVTPHFNLDTLICQKKIVIFTNMKFNVKYVLTLKLLILKSTKS